MKHFCHFVNGDMLNCGRTSIDYLQVPEADDDGQIKIESVGSSLESLKSESVGSSEKIRKRGKDLDWKEVERFDNPQAFNRSQIKVELDRKMRKHRVWRSMGARNQGYVCKVFKKRAWKSCPRKYRVGLLH